MSPQRARSGSRPDLRLIPGGKADEARVVRALFPYERRVVRAEPQPDPNPPKQAA